MSARKQVQDMIRRKAKKFEEFRTNSSRKLTPQQVCFKFFQSFDAIKNDCMDDMEFKWKLERETKLLDSRLQAFDTGVMIELVWHNIDEATNWKEMRLSGVKIQWSPIYQKENPDESPDLHVDIMHYLLEGC